MNLNVIPAILLMITLMSMPTIEEARVEKKKLITIYLINDQIPFEVQR